MSLDLEWTQQWDPTKPVRRRILIEEREDSIGAGDFNVYVEDRFGRRLMRRLTLDEVIGYTAIYIVGGRVGPLKSIEGERGWVERYERAGLLTEGGPRD